MGTSHLRGITASCLFLFSPPYHTTTSHVLSWNIYSPPPHMLSCAPPLTVRASLPPAGSSPRALLLLGAAHCYLCAFITEFRLPGTATGCHICLCFCLRALDATLLFLLLGCTLLPAMPAPCLLCSHLSRTTFRTSCFHHYLYCRTQCVRLDTSHRVPGGGLGTTRSGTVPFWVPSLNYTTCLCAVLLRLAHRLPPCWAWVGLRNRLRTALRPPALPHLLTLPLHWIAMGQVAQEPGHLPRLTATRSWLDLAPLTTAHLSPAPPFYLCTCLPGLSP